MISHYTIRHWWRHTTSVSSLRASLRVADFKSGVTVNTGRLSFNEGPLKKIRKRRSRIRKKYRQERDQQECHWAVIGNSKTSRI